MSAYRDGHRDGNREEEAHVVEPFVDDSDDEKAELKLLPHGQERSGSVDNSANDEKEGHGTYENEFESVLKSSKERGQFRLWRDSKLLAR